MHDIYFLNALNRLGSYHADSLETATFWTPESGETENHYFSPEEKDTILSSCLIYFWSLLKVESLLENN